MKTPLTSQSVGRKPLHKSKIMKKINRTAKVQNFSQKTAESCGYFKILITFAKRLKGDIKMTYNQALTKYKKKRGRPPKFKTAEELAKAFEDYKAFVDANPFEIRTIYKGEESVRYVPHPYTLCGFMVFIDSMSEWCDWKRRVKERGEDFVGVLTRIETEVRDQQVNGGMAGVYNANLTARLNGLTDKKDVTSKGERIDLKFEIVDGKGE